MGKFLNEFYGDDWRDKIVTHKTPTGRTSRVKVGSLSPEEQLKYNPNRFKSTKADGKMTKDDYDKIKPIDKKVRTVDVYIASKDLDVVDDVKNNIQKDKLILATTDSKNVIDLFDDELDVVKLLRVPVASIKKYMVGSVDDIESIDDFEFKDVDTDDEEKLYEISNFSDSTIFLLDLYPYVQEVEIEIDKAGEDDDDFEELKKPVDEGNKFSAFYLNENVGTYITEMPWLVIDDDKYDIYMEKDGWIDKLISIIKNKKHSIDEILKPFYGVYQRFFLKRYKDLEEWEQNRLNKYLPSNFKKDMGI